MSTLYEFAERDPAIAYVDNWLWLPKKEVSVDIIKSSMEVPVINKGVPEMLELWREAPEHIGVPRESVPLDQLGCEVVNLLPDFPKVHFKSSIELDFVNPSRDDQQKAFDDLIHSKGGILNLACGMGKTVVFLHAVSKWETPAIVINDKGHILQQWRRQIEERLEFDGGIGVVQGPPEEWVWEKPIVLASLRSLAKYAHKVPWQMSRHFGVAIWDEIHHLAAPKFSLSAPTILGRRYGATATPNRRDGSQFVYNAHVGPIVHSNMYQAVRPVVTFLKSPTVFNVNDPEVGRHVKDVRGSVNHKKLVAYFAQRPEELLFAELIIAEAVDADRCILALSPSVEHLTALHRRFPESVLITKDTKVQDRLDLIKSHDLVFGTTDLAQEALDKADLDSLVILAEFSSDNALQQSMGRIQRKCDKKKAQVVVIHHSNIRKLNRMAHELKSHFALWGYEVIER